MPGITGTARGWLRLRFRANRGVPTVGAGQTVDVPAPASGKLAFLDALRGFAALWVLVYHVNGLYYPKGSTQGAPLHADPYPGNLFFWSTFSLIQLGFVGVQLFFVVSGFCIHYRQAQAGPNAPLQLSEYARRRFWRIYPAYFASILAAWGMTLLIQFVPMILGVWEQNQLGELLTHYYYCLKYREFGALQLDLVLINATFTQAFWPNALILNGVFWTLAFEAQFYVVYPLFLLLRRRVGLWPLLVLFAALEMTFCTFHWGPVLFFGWRFFEWLLGVLAAEWYVNPPRTSVRLGAKLVAVLSAGFGVASVWTDALFPYRDMFFAVAFFGLIVHCFDGQSAERPGLIKRLLVWAGSFSYSLYLIHFLIIGFAQHVWQCLITAGITGKETLPWLNLLLVPMCLVASYGFYRLFERPFIPKGKKPQGQ